MAPNESKFGDKNPKTQLRNLKNWGKNPEYGKLSFENWKTQFKSPENSVFQKFAQRTPNIQYKGIRYKGFFGPVLKILADLRVLSTECYCDKGTYDKVDVYLCKKQNYRHICYWVNKESR